MPLGSSVSHVQPANSAAEDRLISFVNLGKIFSSSHASLVSTSPCFAHILASSTGLDNNGHVIRLAGKMHPAFPPASSDIAPKSTPEIEKHSLSVCIRHELVADRLTMILINTARQTLRNHYCQADRTINRDAVLCAEAHVLCRIPFHMVFLFKGYPTGTALEASLHIIFQ